MSIQNENTENKQPIKRLEMPIHKFNDVAIPHHIGMLKRHKTNIAKFQRMGDWDRVYREQANASRLVSQLKHLLYEMDTLRGQVRDSDISTFDKLTAFSRASTMNAIQEYLELQFNLPPTRLGLPKDENQSENNPLQEGDIQLHADQEELERKNACLHAWNSLQDDMQQLHQLFTDFNHVVRDQREYVDKIEDDIEVTQVNVTQGTKFLEKAARYKAAAYPLAGALLGTCLGGPVGMIAGLKLGGLTAIGCGVLGFTGGTFLRKKTIRQSAEKQTDIAENRNDGAQETAAPDNAEVDKKQL